MPDPQLVYDVAGRLQGEAGVIGIPGMVAVLYSMWSRLCLGGGFTKGASTHEDAVQVVNSGYFGWAEPSQVARLLAYLLIAYPDTVPQLVEAAGLMRFDGPLPYAMSQQDVEQHGWRPGSVTIMGPKPYAVHLYAGWPEKRGG